MLYKPSELKAFLREIDASPKRRLSQNFLIDGNIVRKIVGFAGVEPGNIVVEIGPGPGALTEELLRRGASVIAVEKDRKFAAALSRLQTPDLRLKVIEEDALVWNGMLHLPPHTKMISNLPYHITTPLLTRFLPHHALFHSMTLMVQREVAERMMAVPGTKAYGSLSLFVQFYSTVRKGFIVEPGCFYPPPKVQSAVIQFLPRKPPDVAEDRFFEMTRRAFQQRRKMLRTSLREKYPPLLLEAGLKKIGKNIQVRPEELSLAEFLMLFKEIDQKQDDLSP